MRPATGAFLLIIHRMSLADPSSNFVIKRKQSDHKAKQHGMLFGRLSAILKK